MWKAKKIGAVVAMTILANALTNAVVEAGDCSANFCKEKIGYDSQLGDCIILGFIPIVGPMLAVDCSQSLDKKVDDCVKSCEEKVQAREHEENRAKQQRVKLIQSTTTMTAESCENYTAANKAMQAYKQLVERRNGMCGLVDTILDGKVADAWIGLVVDGIHSLLSCETTLEKAFATQFYPGFTCAEAKAKKESYLKKLAALAPNVQGACKMTGDILTTDDLTLSWFSLTVLAIHQAGECPSIW